MDLKQYVPLLASVVAGVFAVVSAFITWRLKLSTEAKLRANTREQEQRDTTRDLYVEVHALMERVVRQVLDREFNLEEEVSRLNARVHLLADDHVVSQYEAVTAQLEKWSVVYRKSLPEQIKIGDRAATIYRSPDPTAEFKKPAADAFEALQQELAKLVKLMRSELRGDSASP